MKYMKKKVFENAFQIQIISKYQTYAPNKTQRFKSGFGFSIFLVFGYGFGLFSNLLQISNQIIQNTKKIFNFLGMDLGINLEKIEKNQN